MIDKDIKELEREAHSIDQGDGGVWFLYAIEQPEGTTERDNSLINIHKDTKAYSLCCSSQKREVWH